MSKDKELVCILLPVISQHEVCFLGAKNNVKSKSQGKKKETSRSLISGTVEKCENPVSAAKRIIYDKFDILLDPTVPARIVKTINGDKTIHYVYIDKLFNFEDFPLVHVAADVQEVIMINEYTELSFEREKKVVEQFLSTSEIDTKFYQWEIQSEKMAVA